MAQGEITVVAGDPLRHRLAAPLRRDQLRRRAGGERNPIHARAVKGIDERGGVAHEHEAVTREDCAVIGEIPAPMHVVFVELRVGEHFAANWMFHQEVLQSLSKLAAVPRPFDEALIEDNPYAHVAAFERNPPTPPTVADDVIRRGATDAVSHGSPLRIFFRQFVAIPVLHAFPTRPRCRGRMLGVLPPPSLLARQHRCHPRGVHDPAGAHHLGSFAVAQSDGLLPAVREIHVDDARRSQKLRAERAGAAQHFLVERRAVELVGREADLITPAQLACLGE